MVAVDLPDINVWIALSAPEHAHRIRADRYWHESAPEMVVFNIVTMLGLVRISSNAPLFHGSAKTPIGAWMQFQKWMDLPGTSFMEDSPEVRKTLDTIIHSGVVTGKTFTDAYLAAFAISNGLRLVSFDSDFHRFTDLDFLHLN